jgi:hypothetical protein
MFIGCNISAISTKRLSESTYKDVNAGGVDVEIITDTTSTQAEYTNRIGFIDK